MGLESALEDLSDGFSVRKKVVRNTHHQVKGKPARMVRLQDGASSSGQCRLRFGTRPL